MLQLLLQDRIVACGSTLSGRRLFYAAAMGVVARLVYVSFVAAVGGSCAGAVLAVGALWLAQVMHYGCTPTVFDGREEWICSGGIGFLVPVLLVVALSCVVVLMLASAVEFRGATDGERTRAAALVMYVVGGLLVAQGGFTIPVFFAKYSITAGWASVAVTVAGVALVASAHRSRTIASVVCVATAALLLVCSPGVYLLIPFIVGVAGYLLAVVTILWVTPRELVQSAT